MSLKQLHSFVVETEEEVEKKETITQDGKEITTTSKVKNMVPKTIIIKSPTRRERQNLSVFHTVKYNEGIEQGMLPKAILVQKFLNDPKSPLSKDSDKNMGGLYDKLNSLSNDLLRVNSLKDIEEQDERREKIYNEIISTQRKITDIETSYRSLFAHTAENFAQNQALSWLVLFLSYIKHNEKDEPVPMFSGDTFLEKEQALFDLEDSENKVYFAALEKLSLYCSMYFSGQASKSEDFEKIEIEYEAQLKEEERISKMEEESENEATPEEPEGQKEPEEPVEEDTATPEDTPLDSEEKTP